MKIAKAIAALCGILGLALAAWVYWSNAQIKTTPVTTAIPDPAGASSVKFLAASGNYRIDVLARVPTNQIVLGKWSDPQSVNCKLNILITSASGFSNSVSLLSLRVNAAAFDQSLDLDGGEIFLPKRDGYTLEIANSGSAPWRDSSLSLIRTGNDSSSLVGQILGYTLSGFFLTVCVGAALLIRGHRSGTPYDA